MPPTPSEDKPSILQRIQERQQQQATFAVEWKRACEPGHAFEQAWKPVDWFGFRDTSGALLRVPGTFPGTTDTMYYVEPSTCTVQGWEVEWIKLGEFLNKRPEIRAAVLTVLDELEKLPTSATLGEAREVISGCIRAGLKEQEGLPELRDLVAACDADRGLFATVKQTLCNEYYNTVIGCLNARAIAPMLTRFPQEMESIGYRIRGAAVSTIPPSAPPTANVEDGSASTVDTTDTNGKPKTKRSTKKGEGRKLLIAALTLHHKYADGGCLNVKPIGNNELARMVVVGKRTASAFFAKEFHGHAKYRRLCNDTPRLVAALKALNGEFQPHEFYDARTPDEMPQRDE